MIDFVKDEFGYDMKWKKEWLPHYKMSDLMVEPTISFFLILKIFLLKRRSFWAEHLLKILLGLIMITLLLQ